MNKTTIILHVHRNERKHHAIVRLPEKGIWIDIRN